MGRFPLSWKWVSGETPLDILEMSHLHCMFEKGAPFLLNEGILRRQMDKCSVTLDKNMHVNY